MIILSSNRKLTCVCIVTRNSKQNNFTCMLNVYFRFANNTLNDKSTIKPRRTAEVTYIVGCYFKSYTGKYLVV